MIRIGESLTRSSFSSPPQGGDSDDDVEGFTGSDGTPPSGGSLPAPAEGVSTYGEEDLVPEPHRVRNGSVGPVQCVLEERQQEQFDVQRVFICHVHVAHTAVAEPNMQGMNEVWQYCTL